MAFTLVTPLCLHVNALKVGILPRSRHRLADFFFYMQQVQVISETMK